MRSPRRVAGSSRSLPKQYGGEVFDAVECLVKGGTQEVVHSGVEYHEFFVLAFFHVEYAGNE